MGIEILHRTLLVMKNTYARKNVPLPGVLRIQLDNCVRENKNKYYLAFLCDLVWRDVFHTIIVSFLPVGHTHYDPDQVFSRLSVAFHCFTGKSTPMEGFRTKGSMERSPTWMILSVTLPYSVS